MGTDKNIKLHIVTDIKFGNKNGYILVEIPFLVVISRENGLTVYSSPWRSTTTTMMMKW